MKKLIVTADDCGLSQGINLATVELHQKGIVTDASVMTSFPATAHALELFARYPRLNVGAHLNLTDGFALTEPSARLPSLAGLLARSPSAVYLGWIERELDAQIRVRVDAGFQLTHLTMHLQFHLVPALRDIVTRLAAKYRVSWVRPHRLAATIVPFNPFLRKMIAPADERPTYIAVMKYWMSTRPEKLLEAIKAVSGTVELVVHPDLEKDDTFSNDFRYSPRERYAETQYLERLWPLTANTD